MTSPVVAVVAAVLEKYADGARDALPGYGDDPSAFWVWQQVSDDANRVAEAVVEAQREAVTITTVEQLKRCPRGSVVLSADDRPFRRWPAEDGEDNWTSGEIALPALLLWHPGWVAVDGSAP